ncbi:DNA cytosine methyltransferase [Prauserella sp. ASG 168]|uniref:Cytosine-specific methyltransferase n=1 Tax=Prauserella cavernicola TaxID=2800127 RepID=A0A934QS22_9PSEU|nr:DNA cytosine methyltransferase [Prauserella cavernicola]
MPVTRVRPDPLRRQRFRRAGSLFSGYGGLDMAAAAVLGCEPAWFCEVDPAASAVLAHHWPSTPNLADITTVDWSSVAPVDVLTGGFPCQDLSTAGRRAGLAPGTRSGLWSHMAHAIGVLRPRLVIAENVRGLLSAPAHSDMEPCPWCLGDSGDVAALRALGAVLGDLADLGYDAAWTGLRASDIGAPHHRHRVFVAAVARDADGIPGARRGLAAPGHPEGGRAPAVAGGSGCAPAADTEGERWHEGLTRPARQLRGPDGVLRRRPAADADGRTLRQQRRPARRRRPAPVSRRDRPAPAHTDRSRRQRQPQRHREPLHVGAPHGTDADGRVLDWGPYAHAIRRWETVLDHPAPRPTATSARGGQVLNPALPEWMMGIPGHITAVPGLSRADRLRLAGNGVIPQQAAAALRYLLPRLLAESS